MKRLPTSGLLLISLLLPFGPRAVEAAAGPNDELGEQPALLPDWSLLDWHLDRSQLVQVYLGFDFQPASPLVAWREAMTYDAVPDSLGAEAFVGLPPETRTERRRLADEERSTALRLEIRVRDLWRLNLEGLPYASREDWRAPFGAGFAVTRSLHHLINATGLDPQHVRAWYDLGYLAGVVGDRDRADRARRTAWNLLDRDPRLQPGERLGLGLRLALDQAWLQREQALHERSLLWLDRADSLRQLMKAPPPDVRFEARLLRGLVLADMGRVHEARAVVSELPPAKVYVNDRWVHGSSYARKAVGRTGLKKTSWPRTLDFGVNWVYALTHLQYGDQEAALEVLGPLRIYKNIELPARLNYRFWNDFGLIHERCGRMEEARLCYGLAAVYRPYFIYYPLTPARGVAQVHGQAGAGVPYYLAYRHFYVAGSLFSYAANAALACEIEDEPFRRRILGDCALAALSTCRRLGLHPAASVALRGRLHYFRGEAEAAREDLLVAHHELKEQGHEEPDVVLLLGILAFDVGDYPGSLPWFKRFTELEPERGLGWRALGLAYAYCRQDEAALAALDRAVGLEPGNAAGWFNRSLLHLRAGRWPEARADLTRAADLWPQNPQIAQLLAVAEKGQQREIELVPSRFQLQVSRQDSLRIAQLSRGASLDLTGEIAAGDPDSAFAWLALSTDRAEELLAGLQADYAREPSRSHRIRLAWGLLHAGQPERARDLLLPLWNRGMTAEELCLQLEVDRTLGDPTRATALAASLLTDLEPLPDARLWTLVSLICAEHGLTEHLRPALAQALRLDPENQALQALQARLSP